MDKRNPLEVDRQNMEIQCKFCQQERYGRVKCANTDCQFFYEKYQLEHDIEDLDEKVDKLCKVCDVRKENRDSAILKLITILN